MKMNKKILVTTWCTDDYVDFVGIEKLVNSVKYFHPDVDCIVFNSKMTNEMYEKYPWINTTKKNNWMTAPNCIPFIEDYDMIVRLDGDSTVTGPLDELFESTADIISSRNNNNYNLSQAWEPTSLPHYPPFGNNSIIPVQSYVCAGLIASNNKDFWNYWNDINFYFSDKPDKCVDEQWVLNLIFHSNKYKSEIIDPMGSKVSYGINNAWGPTWDPWQSWKEMYVKNDGLYVYDPVTDKEIHIKILHQAGGALAHKFNKYFGGMRNWMRDIFSKEVNDYIDEITK